MGEVDCVEGRQRETEIEKERYSIKKRSIRYSLPPHVKKRTRISASKATNSDKLITVASENKSNAKKKRNVNDKSVKQTLQNAWQIERDA